MLDPFVLPLLRRKEHADCTRHNYFHAGNFDVAGGIAFRWEQRQITAADTAGDYTETAFINYAIYLRGRARGGFFFYFFRITMSSVARITNGVPLGLFLFREACTCPVFRGKEDENQFAPFNIGSAQYFLDHRGKIEFTPFLTTPRTTSHRLV